MTEPKKDIRSFFTKGAAATPSPCDSEERPKAASSSETSFPPLTLPPLGCSFLAHPAAKPKPSPYLKSTEEKQSPRKTAEAKPKLSPKKPAAPKESEKKVIDLAEDVPAKTKVPAVSPRKRKLEDDIDVKAPIQGEQHKKTKLNEEPAKGKQKEKEEKPQEKSPSKVASPAKSPVKKGVKRELSIEQSDEDASTEVFKPAKKKLKVEAGNEAKAVKQAVPKATPNKIASPKKEIHVHEPIEIVDDEKPIPKPAKEEPKSTKKPEAKPALQKRVSALKVDVSSDEEGGYDPYKQQKDFKPSPKKAVSPKKAAPAPSPKKSPAKKATAVKSNEKPQPQSDEERQAILSKYKPTGGFRGVADRGAPPESGQKTIPIGAPNCLAGKVFIVTGVLESLEREQAEELIVKYGGAVAKSVTKKVTHGVIGDGYGDSKMQKLNEGKLPLINEDGLFDMIRSSAPEKNAAADKKAVETKVVKVTAAVSPKKPPNALIKAGAPIEVSDVATMLWADKYAPTTSDELVGNPAAIEQLRNWLKGWDAERAKEAPADKGGDDGEKKPARKPKTVPRAALVSGPPGIGKTTTCTVLAKELGYDVVALNASDTRNKSSLDSLLKMSSNTSVTHFFAIEGQSKPTNKKTLLIMDEVDGMSSGDKGGVSELIKVIPTSQIPIVCICNDRDAKKVKDLGNACYDVKFRKPTLGQMFGRIKVIAQREGYELSDASLNQILENCQGDMRQVLNLLQMWRATSETLTDKAVKAQLANAGKNITLGASQIVPKLFEKGRDQTSLGDRFDFYYMDNQFIPLMIHDAYIDASTDLHQLSAAADSISDGDLVSESIMRKQMWALMPEEALMSSLRPASICKGHVGGFMQFPTWFMKNSSAQRHIRQVNDIAHHCYEESFADPTSIASEYVPLMAHYLTRPLVQKQNDGIAEVEAFMDRYKLTRDDRDEIIELCEKLGGKSLQDGINSSLKGAFTRQYNKEHFDFKKVSEKAKKNVVEADDGGKGAKKKKAPAKKK